jgi:hypothetical protein
MHSAVADEAVRVLENHGVQIDYVARNDGDSEFAEGVRMGAVVDDGSRCAMCVG